MIWISLAIVLGLVAHVVASALCKVAADHGRDQEPGPQWWTDKAPWNGEESK